MDVKQAESEPGEKDWLCETLLQSLAILLPGSLLSPLRHSQKQSVLKELPPFPIPGGDRCAASQASAGVCMFHLQLTDTQGGFEDPFHAFLVIVRLTRSCLLVIAKSCLC